MNIKITNLAMRWQQNVGQILTEKKVASASTCKTFSSRV
jgi:hypothetical protein